VENHENLSQDSLSTGRDLNPGTPEYEAEVLTTRLRRLITLNSFTSWCCKSRQDADYNNTMHFAHSRIK
jgi:hypothetical protein